MQKQYSINLKNIFIYIAIISLILILAFYTSYYRNIISNTTRAKSDPAKEYSNILKTHLNNESTEIKVKSGDTIRSILNYTLLSNNEIHKLINTLKEFYDPKKLSVGQKFTINFSNEASSDIALFQSMKFKTAIDKEISIYRSSDGEFHAQETTINFSKKIIRVTGKIENSLIATTNSLKIPNDSLHELIKAYSYDIDFQRDIQAGDEIDVIFEKFYNENGDFSHNGNIIYASLSLSDKKLNLYQYQTKTGSYEFYNDEGSSVKKELLRTPVNVVRISSGFGLRKHPILGYGRMHKGVDFAAPIGTPILAAGNGVIEEIRYKGQYGKYVRIRHNNRYSTAYAHASSFNKKLRKGSVVKQGDVIAYVGATGMASGPHLHYEVLENNKQINPVKLKVSSGTRLAGEELNSFKKQKMKVAKLLNNMTNFTEIAYNE